MLLTEAYASQRGLSLLPPRPSESSPCAEGHERHPLLGTQPSKVADSHHPLYELPPPPCAALHRTASIAAGDSADGTGKLGRRIRDGVIARGGAGAPLRCAAFMVTLFVLVPTDHSIDEVVAPDDGGREPLGLRTYPSAMDRAHLLSLVRAGRDPSATRWLRGLVLSIVAGSLLGMLTAGILAGAFAMFGGLVGLALGFGAAVGAFLGAFTAAMTGTERARDEVTLLAKSVKKGDVLVQIGPIGRDDPRLAAMRARCDQLDFARAHCD